jgi:hypothetical protein
VDRREGPTPTLNRLYPGSAGRRRSTVAADAVCLALVALFGWLGWRIYDRIESITALALGVQHTGQSVQGGFADAADAVSGLPVVGDALSGALATAGDATGGNVVDLGVLGEQALHRTALLAGWLVFLLPAAVLLAAYLPRRVARVRAADLARSLLRLDADPERERLLAMRAAFGLPLRQLAQFTDDPIGDLRAGRHDRLLAALWDDSGLDPKQPVATR